MCEPVFVNAGLLNSMAEINTRGITCDMGPHLALVQGDEVAETALVLAPVPLVHGVIARPTAAGG